LHLLAHHVVFRVPGIKSQIFGSDHQTDQGELLILRMPPLFPASDATTYTILYHIQINLVDKPFQPCLMLSFWHFIVWDGADCSTPRSFYLGTWQEVSLVMNIFLFGMNISMGGHKGVHYVSGVQKGGGLSQVDLHRYLIFLSVFSGISKLTWCGVRRSIIIVLCDGEPSFCFCSFLSG
jgi:hypothetical protein